MIKLNNCNNTLNESYMNVDFLKKPDNRKHGNRSFAKGRVTKGGDREGGKGKKKRIKMCYINVPTFHKQCNHYVLSMFILIEILKSCIFTFLLKGNIYSVSVANPNCQHY